MMLELRSYVSIQVSEVIYCQSLLVYVCFSLFHNILLFSLLVPFFTKGFVLLFFVIFLEMDR